MKNGNCKPFRYHQIKNDHIINTKYSELRISQELETAIQLLIYRLRECNQDPF